MGTEARSPSVLPAAGQDELLRRILDPPEGLPDGWAFAGASMAGARVEANYKNGASSVRVWLVQARDAHAGALIVGNLALEGATELPESLVRTLEVSLLAREHRIEWRDPDVDPSFRALRAGVTTTFRVRVDHDAARTVRQKYDGLGAAVVELDGTVLYVARDSSDAERACNLERRLREDAASPAERQVLAEELGWALGHPSCCVEAFVRRSYPSSATLIVSYLAGNVGTAAYRAARDAWVPRPSPRLNPFLRRVRRSLIDFEPCRFDCEKALAHAERVADACALESREWLAETDRQLARPVVIAPNGARAVVRLERRIEPMRIVHAEPQRATEGDATLADRLLGAEARDDGLLSRRGLGWCLLVDFGWRGDR